MRQLLIATLVVPFTLFASTAFAANYTFNVQNHCANRVEVNYGYQQISVPAHGTGSFSSPFLGASTFFEANQYDSEGNQVYDNVYNMPYDLGFTGFFIHENNGVGEPFNGANLSFPYAVSPSTWNANVDNQTLTVTYC